MANIKCNGQIEGQEINAVGELMLDGKKLIDIMYPIGALYLSIQTQNPSNYMGGSWELLPENYALWTCTSGVGGETISAGLPNITGDATLSSGRWDTIEYSGFISAPADFIVSGGHTGNSYRQRGYRVNFDASRSSPIYGQSQTVQPPAIKIFVWKRIS